MQYGQICYAAIVAGGTNAVGLSCLKLETATSTAITLPHGAWVWVN